MSRTCDLILLSMPWGSARYPSLAYSTLKPILIKNGIRTQVRYMNVVFSEMIGSDIYEKLSQDQAVALGEQAFAHQLFPERAQDPEFRAFIERKTDWATYLNLVEKARGLIDYSACLVQDADVVAVGLTTTFYQKMASIALARELKARGSDVAVIFGGAACEPPMGERLLEEFPAIDFVVEGEAERLIVGLARAIMDDEAKPEFDASKIVNARTWAAMSIGRSVVGLGPSGMSTIGVDHSDYVECLASLGVDGRDDWILSYESSRGCWWGEKHHCTFCGLNGMQIRYRRKPSDQVVRDLSAIREAYGPRTVQLTDNIVPHDAFRDFVPKLENIDGQTYFMEVKANLKEADVLAMSRAGVKEIQPGIERLSDEPLKLMRKGTTGLQNLRTIRMGTEYGLIVTWNIIWGFARETEEAVKEEIELVKRVTHLRPPASWNRLRLDRYSPNFNDATELGYLLNGPSEAEKYLFYGCRGVDDLAYHFEFTYGDPPSERLGQLWRELDDCVAHWAETYVPNTLIVFQEGGELIIEDRRNGNEEEFVLTGEAARLLRACSDIRPLHQLEKEYDSLDELLEFFVGENLLIVKGGQALSTVLRDGSCLRANGAVGPSLQPLNIAENSRLRL